MNKKRISILIIVLAVIVIGVIAVVLGTHKQPESINPSVVDNSNQQTEPMDNANETSDIDTPDWKTYRNDEYGFEFRYPDDYTIAIEPRERLQENPAQISFIVDKAYEGPLMNVTLISGDEPEFIEGCCAMSLREPIDLSLTDSELLKLLKAYNVFNVQRFVINGRQALRLYSTSEYGIVATRESILIPYGKGKYTNLRVSSPTLIEGVDRDTVQAATLREDYRDDINVAKKYKLFNEIVSTFKFIDPQY